MQNYTSRNTSINKVKLPTIYSKVSFESGSTVLDYGCGRYIDHIKKEVEDRGCNFIGYDPYNLPGSVLSNETYDYSICSNVLNVIDDEDTIKSIILDLKHHSLCSYISVYEGDKSGVGRETKKDCYQRNQPLKDYLKYFKELGIEVQIKNGIIIMK